MKFSTSFQHKIEQFFEAIPEIIIEELTITEKK